MEKFRDKGFQRLFFLFLVTTILVFFFRSQLTDLKIDPIVVAAGNLVIFLASLLTLSLYGKAKRSKSHHGFSRNMYASFVIKFFILVTAAMLYFYFSNEISSRAVFVCLGLYLVYHFLGAAFAARVEKIPVRQK